MWRLNSGPTWSASCSSRRARATSGWRPRASLGERVAGRAGKVALTVDATDETLTDIVAALKPDMLQLHGKETPGARRRWCARRFGLPVMKALPIAERARPLAHPHLRQGRRPADVRRARAQGGDAARRPRQAVRLDAARRHRSRRALHAVGRARRRQRGARRLPSPVRRASMCPPASSARRARRTRPRSAHSSAPCARGGGAARSVDRRTIQ